MIVVNIRGGLGNQLFQYALGRHLSIKNDCELLLDLSFYNSPHKHRNFQLNYFNTKFNTASDILVKKYKKFNNADLNKYLNYSKFIFNSFSESRFKSYNPDILDKKKGYFDGYWQSEKYFIEIQDIIKSDLLAVSYRPIVKNFLSQIIDTNSISIHVRKTDYLTIKNISLYADCGIDYYNSAIEYIANIVDKPHFFIFSDDFEWVKNNLKMQFPHTFINTNNLACEDLFLMSQCNNNIIANSTFSWWGAWLNINKKKEVIVPSNWFKDKRISTGDLIPGDWTKIKN